MFYMPSFHVLIPSPIHSACIMTKVDKSFVEPLCRHQTQVILNQRERNPKEKDQPREHIAKDSFSLFEKCVSSYILCVRVTGRDISPQIR